MGADMRTCQSIGSGLQAPDCGLRRVPAFPKPEVRSPKPHGLLHGLMKRMRGVVLSLVVAACAPSSSAASQGTAPPPATTLTALDYIEIEQLVYRYARAIDTCSNNGYDYADLFTPDGFFAPSRDGTVGPKWEGRERLAEASGGGVRGCKNVGWIQQGVLHIYTNHVITPTDGGAKGTVDMLMIGLGGDPRRIERDGYYEDTYAKTPQGWRFKSRIHHTTANRGQETRAPAEAQPR